MEEYAMRAYAERREPGKDATDARARGRSGALAAGLLVAISFAPPGARATTTPAGSCGDVASYGPPNTEITSAQENPAANGLSRHE
jgi:hypothetical protein